MAEWFFRKKSKGEVERDPGWDEYFTSNRSTAESLVREAIQNSLDANAKARDKNPSLKDAPARVRIYYSGKAKALGKSTYGKYLDGAVPHYKARECKLDEAGEIFAAVQEDLFGDKQDGGCTFVTIEDFNTTGLTGEPDHDYSNVEIKPPYYRFFWSENQSEKGEGTRGKWGIGKVVFPIASRLRTFFAYSIRDSEAPRELLCGKALLTYHTVDGERYSADGWWGTQKKDWNLPESNAASIGEFKRDFNLCRNAEPGLSVVVPYVKELDWNEIKRVLVENYMVSLVRGELQVELENGDGDKVVYDSAHLSDIEKFLSELPSDDSSAKSLLQAFKMVCEGLTAPKEYRLEAYDGECPEWQAGMFTDSTLAEIRDELEKTDADGLGNPVTIIVPMRIAKKHPKCETMGEFKVVLRRVPGLVARPLFYRAGLYINRVRPNNIANFVSVVLIDGSVSDMLNQAEPPSHSEWRVLTGDFQKLFRYSSQHIDFVVRAVRRLVDRIDETEKGLDRTTLKNIFFVSRAKSLATLRKGKGAGKGSGQGGAKDTQENGGANEKGEAPNFDEMDSKPKPYSIYPVKDGDDSGIAIKANTKDFKPFDLKVSFFYETLSGKVKFDENDFSFLKKDSLSVSWEPVELSVKFPAANRLRLKVTEATKDFKLTVRGFDANRDLRVIPHSEDLKEEVDGAEL